MTTAELRADALREAQQMQDAARYHAEHGSPDTAAEYQHAADAAAQRLTAFTR